MKNTAKAGMIKILSEGGVAAGVRRIEAVTGMGVYEYITARDEEVAKVSKTLKTTEHDLLKKSEAVMEELKNTQKELESLKAKMAAEQAGDIMNNAEKIGDIDLISARFDSQTPDALKTMADDIKSKNTNAVIVLAALTDGKITFVAMAGKDALQKGIHAGKIIKEITAIAGGSGGGKPDMAQGGGKDESKIDEALSKVYDVVKEQLN